MVAEKPEEKPSLLQFNTCLLYTSMKECKNRIACFEDQLTWGWLRNATKEEFSSASFAHVSFLGYANYSGASDSYGVRPEFWLVKQESRGRLLLQYQSIHQLYVLV